MAAVLAEDQSLKQCRPTTHSPLASRKSTPVVAYDALVLLILSQSDVSWMMFWNEYIPLTPLSLANVDSLCEGVYIPFLLPIAIYTSIGRIGQNGMQGIIAGTMPANLSTQSTTNPLVR